MANHGEPKDYMLGRKAYKAFFEVLGIEFTDLSHEYQMRWVNVARAVMGENKRLAPRKTKESAPVQDMLGVSDEQLLNSAPRKPSGRIDYKQVPASLKARLLKVATRASKRKYYEASVRAKVGAKP
jgi:hypothetical protein